MGWNSLARIWNFSSLIQDLRDVLSDIDYVSVLSKVWHGEFWGQNS